MIMKGNIIRDIGFDIVNFLIVSNRYFEDLGAYKVEDRSVEELLCNYCKDYEIKREGIWYFCYPKGGKLVRQGWKIHVSSSTHNITKTLKRVLPILVENGLLFKVVCDKAMLMLVNSKNFNRASSGKFITIYPSSLLQFKTIIEKLYQATIDLEGPYILSDKPYKDSKVIFYRYGAFIPEFIINIYGEKIPVLLTPDGTRVQDRRTPYPSFPEWVSDPFTENNVDENVDENEEIILNDKYIIKHALLFSNSGDVYVGEEISSGKKVVIKEARPFVEIPTSLKLKSSTTAQDLLVKEFNILKKLQDTGYVPYPIEIFEEEGHLFLVMEYVEGVPLTVFRAREDFCLILKKRHIKEFKKKFLKKFYIISSQIIQAVNHFHKRDIIVNDISPNNILVDPVSLKVTFIDFEAAIDLEWHEKKKISLFTPGFSLSYENNKGIYKEDDYYSVGAVLYSTIIPITSFFDLSKSAKAEILEEVFKYYSLPRGLKSFILGLMNESRKKRIDLSKINNTMLKRIFNSPEYKTSKENSRKELKEILEHTLDSMINFILNNMDVRRKDRLFPSDYRVFLTNPLNIAYGALGTAYFIYKYLGYIPKEIEDWIFSHKITPDNYPPSFYVGLSGIGYVLYEMGYRDKAEDIMELLYSSPLLYEGYDIFYGAAGWGLSSLYFYLNTRNEKYLQKAINAADFLIGKAKHERNSIYWENADGEIYFGFLHGNSGIAYFYFCLYLITNEEKYLNIALKAINFELYNCQIVEEDYISLPKSMSTKKITMPYFQYGSSGLGMVLIRMLQKLNIDVFKFLAEKIAVDSSGKFAPYPTIFRGLSGLGQFLIDMFICTGEQKYLDIAYEIASGCLMFKVKERNGICFLGEELLRLGCDYGLGSAGVGMFFLRLLKLEGREFMLDEFFEKPDTEKEDKYERPVQDFTY